MPRSSLLVHIAATLVFTAAPAAAQTSSNFCAAGKVEASGLFMSAVLDCYANSTNRNGTPDAKCIRQATRGLDLAFAFLERWTACETVGDNAAVAGRVLDAAAQLSAMVNAPRPTQCARQELSAMAQDATWQYTCRAAAVLKGAGSPEARCQDRGSNAFFIAFDRAASRRDCGPTPSDDAAIDARIREAAADARNTIKPPVTTCAPIEVTALHGGSFQGNSRLAKITNGQVACLHADEGTLASCAFSTLPGRQSGEWLESPSGRFALVGQSIWLDGTPGGDYVIAAAVSSSAPASCVEPTSMDTVGRIEDGVALAESCVVEDIGAQYNALSAVHGWTPLLNWADREVCTANRPGTHPDFAYMSRSYSSSGSGPDDTFCYEGPGAALNDLNGRERDGAGNYWDGDEFCHFIQVSGYEVPGAKRPATFSYPAPGGINTRSIVLWRPVSPNFDIANGGGTPVVQTFEEKQEFLTTTGATTASGPLPDLGAVGNGVTVGTVTLSMAAGGNTLFIGSTGTGAEPDWYPLLAGNDIALGFENLQVQTATPVYSLGFDFVEPNISMPPFGGTPEDSTFEIVLYSGATEVGRTTFNALDDVVTFVGVWSERAFDRATIVDTTGNHDDEFFGQFYTGVVRRP